MPASAPAAARRNRTRSASRPVAADSAIPPGSPRSWPPAPGWPSWWPPSTSGSRRYPACRITERIGRGGMATVFKAHHDALSRYVAIKVLPEFLAEQEGFTERFQQEAVAIAHLRHPSILAVYDYGEEDGNHYIVEEFVEGGTLSDRMGKPHTLDETVSVLSPLRSALDYAHARGVLHRDVKPSNIMLTGDGTPILGDFGLAKMMGGADAHLTMSGMIVGTPEYMAPEQCAGQDIDATADVYSLAVVA